MTFLIIGAIIKEVEEELSWDTGVPKLSQREHTGTYFKAWLV